MTVWNICLDQAEALEWKLEQCQVLYSGRVSTFHDAYTYQSSLAGRMQYDLMMVMPQTLPN